MEAKIQGLGLGFPAFSEGAQRRQEGGATEQPTVEHDREKQQQSLQAGGGRREGGGGGGAPGSDGEERSSGCRDHVSHSSSPVGFGSSSRSSSAFSSVSASGGRCSFRSDHDASFSSQLSPQHLAGRGRCSDPDPDPDRARRWPSLDTTTAPSKSRECLTRPFRSEAFATPAEGRHWRRRPNSLDPNSQGSNVPLSSPGILASGAGVTNNSDMSVRSRSGTFPSPGTPSYGHGGSGAGGTAVYQKGWSSERVPLPAHSGRRFGNSMVLLPFNNGRALPSKWEDAEKWIFSPVSGEGGAGRSSAQPPSHRRPRSKSGPLGPPMGMSSCYSSASPLMPGSERRRTGNFTMGSPLLAGVLLTERRCCVSINGGKCGSGSEGALDVREGGGKSYSAQVELGIARSASVHGWPDLLMESYSSLPSSQGGKLEGSKDSDLMPSPGILRKDMATQMSPEHSTPHSPKQRPHFSPPPKTSPTIQEFQSHLSKLEFRDVQVDDHVTSTRWSKKHITRGTENCSANIIQWKKKALESRASSWKVTETAKCISKFRREEAKITAWENLQKAKTEAEIRKLEMKLEKMRSASMNKIFDKLRSAQGKAQEKRDSVASSQAYQVARRAKKVPFCRKAQIGSLSGCFTCHAF